MKRDGKGTLLLSNGNFYEGEFKGELQIRPIVQQLRTNLRQPTLVHGLRFTLLDDKMNGLGMYRWSNGDMYQGHFRMGVRAQIMNRLTCRCAKDLER